MKKSKLLIPALSIASVGAVVAPIATSCNSSSTFMIITKTDYVGTVHDEVAKPGWDQAKATGEYFKDKKYIVEDMATDTIAYFLKSHTTEDLSNAKVESFSLKVNNLTLGRERIHVTQDGAYFGYLVSGSYDCTMKASWDAKPKSEETEIEKRHHEDTATIHMNFNNCFARVGYNAEDKAWCLYINGYNAVSLDWFIKISGEGTYKTSTVYKTGVTKTETLTGSGLDSYSIKTGSDGHTIFVGGNSTKNYIASNYLSKVAYNE